MPVEASAIIRGRRAITTQFLGRYWKMEPRLKKPA